MTTPTLQDYIKQHRFKDLFIEYFGWDKRKRWLRMDVDGQTVELQSIAQMRGLRVYCCELHRKLLANRTFLRRVQRQLIRQQGEHVIVYHSKEPLNQVWQWAIQQGDGPTIRHLERPFPSCTPPEALLVRLSNLQCTLDEEETATTADVMAKTRRALKVIPQQELFPRFLTYVKKSDDLAATERVGTPEAPDRFCKFNLRLAKKASRILRHWFGIDEDDAFQIACIGLVQAAERYDPACGWQFSTYANYWMMRSCERIGADTAFLIRFPQHVIWPLYRLQFTERRLLASHGLPIARERHYLACQSIGIRACDWDTFDRVRNLQTFSELERDDWNSLRSIQDPCQSPAERSRSVEIRQEIAKGLARLSQREHNVIHYRYGIGCAEHTLEEIAEIYGLTREGIRQIQSKAESRLQIFLKCLDPARDSALDDCFWD